MRTATRRASTSTKTYEARSQDVQEGYNPLLELYSMEEAEFLQADKAPVRRSNTLLKKVHVERLVQCLTGQTKLPQHYVPTQCWIAYWVTHSLCLLDQQQAVEASSQNLITFISDCADKNGGYGGGPGQIAHIATTYASVNALISLSSDSALESIDRAKLVRFLRSVKQDDGSFAMHVDGEIDSRATYCALSVIKCLNVEDELLLDKAADWILSCQTYEGGFGSVPGSEAHGGYTFCCVASLCLLNQLHRANLDALSRWLCNKQLPEGGFCGRSNKLVDSCYSFWQGAVYPLVYSYTSNTSQPPVKQGNQSSWMFDAEALQDYILNSCQVKTGLLRDKPEAPPDYYHTCYALSGLSISQHQPNGTLFDIGSQQINRIAPIHPLFNLTPDSLKHCLCYFENKKLKTLVKLNEQSE